MKRSVSASKDEVHLGFPGHLACVLLVERRQFLEQLGQRSVLVGRRRLEQEGGRAVHVCRMGYDTLVARNDARRLDNFIRRGDPVRLAAELVSLVRRGRHPLLLSTPGADLGPRIDVRFCSLLVVVHDPLSLKWGAGSARPTLARLFSEKREPASKGINKMRLFG